MLTVMKLTNAARYLSKFAQISPSVAMSALRKNIVWMDMEMTGLDPEKDHILEIACVITDSQLEIIAEGPDIIIHHSDEVLKNMNPWCISHHGESGLIEASQTSTTNIKQAESSLLNFISKYSPAGASPLAGNSIYMDRMFLRRHLPVINEYLHYRIIDVSTIKELCRRWYPEIYKEQPNKRFAHRAIFDIVDSINELKYYKEKAFINCN